MKYTRPKTKEDEINVNFVSCQVFFDQSPCSLVQIAGKPLLRDVPIQYQYS